ncbi:MAG: hypothetical protein R3A50_15155 [Saprospiraceae bacterium]|nr:hypothetical protein [Saprospiraceae bacterium]MCB9344340.1 hypothetical protein [Lewinellaceae bacterium]
MSTDKRIRKKLSFRSPMLFVGFAMTLFYLVLGTWLLADKSFLSAMPTDFRDIFAIMLVVYGLYRGWRIWADTRIRD